MTPTPRLLALGAVVPLALSGCGDDRATVSGTGTTGTATAATASPPATATSEPPGPGTTTTTTGITTTGATTTDDTSSLKFDLGDPLGTDDCPGGGEPAFSFIWIANSVAGTVSKIDTFTAVEVARYVTGPHTAGLGDPTSGPSRTSVNLHGDAAVANRNGGVTKIAARLADCRDRNGDGLIDTSRGPHDVKPWGADECVSWHHPTPTDPLEPTEGPRPLAWVGELDPRGCPVRDPPLWLGYYDKARSRGVFERLDGATGQALDTVEVPWPERRWGPYGGAVNGDGDLFVIGWGDAPAIRIDHDTLDVTVFHHEGAPFHYGMALDARGELWVAGCDRIIYHLDPATQLWSNIGTGPGCLRGVMVDQRGRAFIAHNGAPPGLVVVDTDARAIVTPNLVLPGAAIPVGVSIDVEGYVWVVDQGGWAYKLDPDTHQIISEVRGLQSPYTYSDMTGAGLNLVVKPPG